MELRETVARRRMVRRYRDTPVPRATVRRILDTARRAPSAGFSQGQRFLVITDGGRRAEVAALAGEDAYVDAGFHPWLSAAPVHVVPCVDEQAYRDRYAESDKLGPDAEPDWPVPYWWLDAGASFMLLLLAAVDEGLAAGFLGVHRLPGLADLLGIPARIHPIGVVTIGHPLRDRRSGSLDRGWHDLDEVVHHETWGAGG